MPLRRGSRILLVRRGKAASSVIGRLAGFEHGQWPLRSLMWVEIRIAHLPNRLCCQHLQVNHTEEVERQRRPDCDCLHLYQYTHTKLAQVPVPAFGVGEFRDRWS